MKVKNIIDALEQNRMVFEGLLSGAKAEFVDWKPQENNWSVKNIVAHLYDEEREDFRARMLHYIYTPHENLKPIDPEGWVKEREYDKMDYQIVLADFLKERKESVLILRGIPDNIWSNEYEHPKFGTVGPLFFVTNWLAHDLKHIKQINRLRYAFLQFESNISLDYAG